MGTMTNMSEKEDLSFQDLEYKDCMLESLNKLRKERKLCDAIVVVGAHEFPLHKAVLASASSYLLEMFCTMDNKHMFKLRDVQDHESFNSLLSYAYTGRLEVPAESVRAVYQTSTHLKMQAASKACADYLARNISVENCLGTRMFATDDNLRRTADKFIQDNLKEVMTGKKFFGLPQVPVEIVGADQDLIESSDDKHMFELLLSWARENINPDKPRLEDLTEQVNVLNLNTDNSLTDFKDISHEKVKEEDGIVQDYQKKKKLNVPKPKGTGSSNLSPGKAPVRKFSINPDSPMSPKEWSIIARCQVKANTYMALAMLNGDLATISIHYRPTSLTNDHSSSEEPDSPVQNSATPSKFFDMNASLTPLAVMSNSRCAFGLEVVDGKLIACGGYDRSECLKSSEMYDIHTNQWKTLENMNVPRARFSVAAINGRIYAVGGSNGFNEQKVLEYFDRSTKKWKTAGEVTRAKVSQGVASLRGKLYYIGGCVGQKSVTDCQVYDPETNTWGNIAPLNTARYQAAVCAFQGKLYALGGTDAWTCLNTIEIYDPETDTWHYGPSLNVARRGAGSDILDGKIFLAGGSDGTQSLKSTEILDPDKGWILGPPMSVPRANVGVITYSNRLFAVGGFSGKKFLDSLEYLNVNSDEWCCYLPVEDSVIAHKVQKRASGGCESLDKNSNCLQVNGGESVAIDH